MITLKAPLVETLLAALDEGIHVVDRQGITVLYNAQAGWNDGLEPQEVVGRHLLSVYPSLNSETSTLLKVLETGEAILQKQQTFTNYKGLPVTTINSTYPILDEHGELIGAVEVSKDITQVKALSEQLVSLKAELMGQRRGPAAAQHDARYTLDDLVGQHPGLLWLKERAQRAAQSDSPIMVYGETGTGKELLIHGIHGASPRRGGALVAQNCAALPEGLLEGLLFGTAKGSFTGAEDRPGLFELAHGGTLYLDEINSMDLGLQAKLLRVLQDGRVRRVGGMSERVVDVRIIASTNEEPAEAVRQGRLRQDLYFRLNVVGLEIPPLRDRQSDVPLLTEFFLRKHRARLGAKVEGVSAEVTRLFAAYHWPGNVRELEHAVEAGAQMARGKVVTLSDLPMHLQRAAQQLGIHAQEQPMVTPVKAAASELRGALVEAEREAVLAALKETNWNVSRTSRLLGIPRQTLQYRMKVLGLNERNQA